MDLFSFSCPQIGNARKGEISSTKGNEVQKDPIECVRLEINVERLGGVCQMGNKSMCMYAPFHRLHPFQLKKED